MDAITSHTPFEDLWFEVWSEATSLLLTRTQWWCDVNTFFAAVSTTLYRKSHRSFIDYGHAGLVVTNEWIITLTKRGKEYLDFLRSKVSSSTRVILDANRN